MNAVIVIDPASTGAVLAHTITVADPTLSMICVWSNVIPDGIKAHVQEGLEVKYTAVIQHVAGALDATVQKVRATGLNVVSVMVGCETGVNLNDELSHALQMEGNSIAHTSLRRDKYLQTEAVRTAGLNAMMQVQATADAEVEAFLLQRTIDGTFHKSVVKPVEGAGSDGVSLCDTADEVRSSFRALNGATNVLGLVNAGALLQEFLCGDEYVVDTVSYKGEHKCVALWVYDKRYVDRDAPVVYYGMHCLETTSDPKRRQMVEYVFGVLDAIGFSHGAAHSEVKLEARGPVLIEVNCRLHGGEGTWLPVAAAGHVAGATQVTALIDASLRPSAFAQLPALPASLAKHGAWVTVRSTVEGEISRINTERLEVMRALRSFNNDYLPEKLRPGQPIVRTTDACTVHGCVNLIHADPAVLAEDYEACQRLMDLGLFEVVAEEAKAAAPAAAACAPAAAEDDAKRAAAIAALAAEPPLVMPKYVVSPKTSRPGAMPLSIHHAGAGFYGLQAVPVKEYFRVRRGMKI